jgi:cytochrome b6-f complex iron-sulfur subunit
MIDQENPTRRTFLDGLIGFCSGVTAAALAIPSGLYLWPAAKGGESEKVEVDGADTMSPGDSRMVRVGGKAVIVVRKRDGFEAYSAECTHLGCLVTWSAPENQFVCPCHAAVFDASGNVVSGPPPAPLPPYRVQEVDGKVYISAMQQA